MIRTKLLATLLGSALLFSLSGCGTSDKLSSLTLTTADSTGTFNVKGIGGTLQLKVTANYTSGKIVDETNWSTFTITPEGFDVNTGLTPPTPPLGITLNTTGMVTAVDPPTCTWQAVSSGGSSSTTSYFLIGDYQIIAHYKGLSSQPVFVGVASAADGTNTSNGDQCGP